MKLNGGVSITIVISPRALYRTTIFQWDWKCSFSVFYSESPWELVLCWSYS